MISNLKTKRIYVLIVVAICFLVEFLALGFCSGTKKLFLGPITAALGFERSLFGFNATCRYVFTAGIALFFGLGRLIRWLVFWFKDRKG